MLNATKILIVLPERLGDALFCTPAIALLKQYRPNMIIDVLCQSRLSSEVLHYNPAVNNVYILPTKRELRHLRGVYDIGINIHDNIKAREYFAWLGLKTHTIPARDNTVHQSLQALRFIQDLLACPNPSNEAMAYKLYPQAQHFAHIEALLAKHSATPYLIGCHLGCHGIAKQGWRFWRKPSHPKVWPIENFVTLAEKLLPHQARLVLTGSPAEQPLADAFLQRQIPVINLIGQTSVLELTALMSHLHAFVAPDTGTLHVACATTVPIVALFGPTQLTLTGPYPWRDNMRVLSAETMADLSVATVTQTVLELLPHG